MKISEDEISAAILEMRDLLRLLAQPAIAERDKKQRAELRRIVGNSTPKAKAALLMNGNHLQTAIVKAIGINQGQLSTFVKQLYEGKLLVDDTKVPKLAIGIPSNFFEKDAEDER